jgi:carboxylesterase
MSRISSQDVSEILLDDSYHVATIDNDARRIFDESAKFIGRTTEI